MEFWRQTVKSTAFPPAAQFALGAILGLSQPTLWAATPEASPVTVRLEYRVTSEALIQRAVGVKPEPSPFPKEPALSKREIFRGRLLWGHASEPPLAFIWDKPQGKLYLDLNRNRDLTDDPQGVFSRGTNSNYQLFTNVELPRVTAAGVRPARVQLAFGSYGAGVPYASAGLVSYWEAKASLGGREWQAGVVEDVLEAKKSVAPAFLLLRPWSERERPFHLNTSSPDFAEFSTGLFFREQSYALDCRFEAQEAAPGYRLTFSPQPARLGELRVTGAFLHRLILKEDKGLVAILDQPEGTQRIPAGNYALEEIWLRQGDTEATRFKAGRITVDPARPASLTAGGPLTNSVQLADQGYNLSLRYELLGADGSTYHFPRPDYEHPPEFAIFHGTNRLAADKFRYG